MNTKSAPDLGERGCLRPQFSPDRSTFQAELNAWSQDLTVEVAGHGVVSHAGSTVVRMIADGTVLTAGLSKALHRRGFVPVHDRGRVLADTAVMIADGGRVLSDLATLRDHPRDLDDAGVVELTGLLRDHPKGDQLANWPAGMRVICRRERSSARAQLSLFEAADGWRYQLIATNTLTGQPDFLEARHRPMPGWRTAAPRTPASNICRQSPMRSTRPGVWPP